jgi:hypothetical protein
MLVARVRSQPVDGTVVVVVLLLARVVVAVVPLMFVDRLWLPMLR